MGEGGEVPKCDNDVAAGGRVELVRCVHMGKMAQPARKHIGIWGKLVTLPWGEGGFQATPSGTPFLPPEFGPLPADFSSYHWPAVVGCLAVGLR